VSISGPGSERRAFLVFVVLAVVATIGVIVWMRPEPAERGAADSPRSSTQQTEQTAPEIAPERKARKKPKKRKAEPVDFSSLAPPELGTGPGGLSGDGDSSSMPRHRMTVTLTSTGPIGYIAMVIPTDTKHNGDKEYVAGSRWSLSTMVYGPPDYIAIFAQGGYDGRQVHCTVTVDGRVTASRSTEGPYGTIWCQG